EAGMFFQYIHEYYPDSYFINVERDVNRWIASRARHGGDSFRNRYMTALNLSSDQIYTYWEKQFLRHNLKVERYFSSIPSARFLKFDLDRDNVERVCEFLSGNFNLDPSLWMRENYSTHAT